MEIVAFETLTREQVAEAARILREAFAHIPAYDGPGLAEAETQTFLVDPERFALAAVEGQTVLGWIGGLADTYRHGLELHPLVVDPPRQAQGVGRALVTALEARARAMEKLTVYLGTDDEFGGTSLFGADLYPDPIGRLAAIEPIDGHPFFFYRRLGYVAVGVFPDVNGAGKPDIFMAKRL
jgi:aminoglycoside 6'-N-acetyltransferase I